ncbi:sel1 repeat family protein [Reinekea sp. G2M2-21]|uniref:sel1 repeat family protein n=1 Tax=Reinekea sp. G2M2-21 TaxID=2788942 RepID=UPI0018A96C6C|nr:sel1 repeat family protein [Reinekea sp. G2M2-21]
MKSYLKMFFCAVVLGNLTALSFAADVTAFNRSFQGAIEGDVEAMLELAEFLDQGEMGTASHDQAFGWVLRAANAVDRAEEPGIYHSVVLKLAKRYVEGNGVERDYKAAMHWLLRGTENETIYDLYMANSALWIFLTNPIDGSEDLFNSALELLLTNSNLSDYPASMDSVALAMARLGFFEKAIEFQKNAISLVDENEQASYGKPLEDYARGVLPDVLVNRLPQQAKTNDLYGQWEVFDDDLFGFLVFDARGFAIFSSDDGELNYEAGGELSFIAEEDKVSFHISNQVEHKARWIMMCEYDNCEVLLAHRLPEPPIQKVPFVGSWAIQGVNFILKGSQNGTFTLIDMNETDVSYSGFYVPLYAYGLPKSFLLIDNDSLEGFVMEFTGSDAAAYVYINKTSDVNGNLTRYKLNKL